MAGDIAPIEIEHYSDVLCVWAYLGQARVDELARTFGPKVLIRTRFCSVFSDTRTKFEIGKKDQGGYAFPAAEVRNTVTAFPHVAVGPGVWTEAKPASSAPIHLFIKAVQVLEEEDRGCSSDAIPYLERLSTRAAWALRLAFFAEGRDIAAAGVQAEVAKELGLDPARIFAPETMLRAVAALAQDMDAVRAKGVEGSPTFIMNAGRQKLFGNVGYRLLEANVDELLRRPNPDAVSWC